MTEALNPLQKPLATLWERLNSLNGLLFLLENVCQNFERLITHHAKEKGWSLDHTLHLGSCLALTDLTGPTEKGWLLHAPTPSRFVASGAQYLETMKALVRRESAWAVAQGYEGFETFLKCTAAEYLRASPEKADDKARQRYLRTLNHKDRIQNTTEHWLAFVDSAYRGKRDNARLFELLRSWAPELVQGEKGNNWQIDLVKWYRAAAAARHAATHANLVIKGRAANEALPDDKKFFPCRYENDIRTLDLGVKNANSVVEVFANYGFLIFKCLSRTRGYDWEIVRGLKPGEKAKA